MTKFNKFDLMNKVTISELAPGDKVLLIELILRWNTETGQLNPSVERLCKARGIKHEKNFKGVETYLNGLVTKTKHGRKNYYQLNIEAIMCLEELKVTIKHTPALEGVSRTEAAAIINTPAHEGVYTPAVEGANTPAAADNTPAVEGANSSHNTSIDSSIDSSGPVDADASPLNSKSNLTQGEVTKKEEVVVVDSPLDSNSVELPFVDNKSSALEEDVWAFLDREEKSSAPADAPAPAARPVERDISIEEFIAEVETMTEEEQNVAAYGFEYKASHALQQILLVARESSKPEYDMWKTESHKYTYASDNVHYEGPGRNKKEQPVAAGNATGYSLDEEW